MKFCIKVGKNKEIKHFVWNCTSFTLLIATFKCITWLHNSYCIPPTLLGERKQILWRGNDWEKVWNFIDLKVWEPCIYVVNTQTLHIKTMCFSEWFAFICSWDPKPVPQYSKAVCLLLQAFPCELRRSALITTACQLQKLTTFNKLIGTIQYFNIFHNLG